MRNRILSLTGAMAIAIAAATLTVVPAHSQAAKAAPKKAYTPPRLPDGHPDLQGTYDVATLTPVERPSSAKSAVYTSEEAAKLEKATAETKAKGDEAIKGDRSAPPKGGDGSVGAAGNVGGYNTFWLDPGTKYTVVDGQIRTSIVVDPPDGRVPPITAKARERVLSMRARPTSDALESRDPGLEPAGAYDDPERRPLGERCLLGFASTSGPPALPDYFYNNLHQIVQTKDSVMILTEMVHDARVVRMNAQHLPSTIRRWMGDSVGHWEGDTLVIDTTNFNDKTRFRGSTQNLHVIERLSRMDAKTLLYRFTIEDPETWDRPWTGEYAWPLTNEPIFEYACHEANYAMGDILRGARLREAEAAAAKSKQ